MVTPYHMDLYRPLEGPRNFFTEERGPFTLRMDPHHVAESVCAIRHRRLMDLVEERIRSMRLTRYLMSIA